MTETKDNIKWEMTVTGITETEYKLLLRILRSVNMADFFMEDAEERIETIKEKIKNAKFIRE